MVQADELRRLGQNVLVTQGFGLVSTHLEHRHGRVPLFGKIKQPPQMEIDHGCGPPVSHPFGRKQGLLQDAGQL